MHLDNFNLSTEAQNYAEELIREVEVNRRFYGGIISKSNVKLDDNYELIEVNNVVKKM